MDTTSHKDSEPSHKAAPLKIGDYLLKKTLGKGTFGKVQLGIHIPSKEKVAIKILDRSKINEKDDAIRVKREFEMIQIFNHPNVIFVTEIFAYRNNYYIVMDYCEGGELFNYIVKKHRLNEKEASFFYYQIINGLEYIHKLGIVHRDLKPENLLLTRDLTLKIIDFGLSNYFDKKLLSTPCGSPCYASPEMVSGHKYNGFCIDVWSTGIILYAMLCGYLPFEDKDNDVLFRKILKCKLELPRHLSEDAKDLIKRILVTNPAKRITIKEIKRHPFFLKGKSLFNREFSSRKVPNEVEFEKEDDAHSNHLKTEGNDNAPLNTKNHYFYSTLSPKKPTEINTVNDVKHKDNNNNNNNNDNDAINNTNHKRKTPLSKPSTSKTSHHHTRERKAQTNPYGFNMNSATQPQNTNNEGLTVHKVINTEPNLKPHTIDNTTTHNHINNTISSTVNKKRQQSNRPKQITLKTSFPITPAPLLASLRTQQQQKQKNEELLTIKNAVINLNIKTTFFCKGKKFKKKGLELKTLDSHTVRTDTNTYGTNYEETIDSLNNRGRTVSTTKNKTKEGNEWNYKHNKMNSLRMNNGIGITLRGRRFTYMGGMKERSDKRFSLSKDKQIVLAYLIKKIKQGH